MLIKSHVIETELQFGLKSELGHAQLLCFPGNKMAAATKEKQFRWSKGDKIENLFRCLANFKAEMEYKNIDFKADKVKQYKAVREAMVRIYSCMKKNRLLLHQCPHLWTRSMKGRWLKFREGRRSIKS